MNKCENCQFAWKEPNALYCRRNPPVANAQVVQGPLGQPQLQVSGYQPPVQPEGWCGEHKRKLEIA